MSVNTFTFFVAGQSVYAIFAIGKSTRWASGTRKPREILNECRVSVAKYANSWRFLSLSHSAAVCRMIYPIWAYQIPSSEKSLINHFESWHNEVFFNVSTANYARLHSVARAIKILMAMHMSGSGVGRPQQQQQQHQTESGFCVKSLQLVAH